MKKDVDIFVAFPQIFGMLFHRRETFLHVISVTDLCGGAASKQDSVNNMMELAWVATHLDDDAISVGTESVWSDFSGEIDVRKVTSFVCCTIWNPSLKSSELNVQQCSTFEALFAPEISVLLG